MVVAQETCGGTTPGWGRLTVLQPYTSTSCREFALMNYPRQQHGWTIHQPAKAVFVPIGGTAVDAPPPPLLRTSIVKVFSIFGWHSRFTTLFLAMHSVFDPPISSPSCCQFLRCGPPSSKVLTAGKMRVTPRGTFFWGCIGSRQVLACVREALYAKLVFQGSQGIKTVAQHRRTPTTSRT